MDFNFTVLPTAVKFKIFVPYGIQLIHHDNFLGNNMIWPISTYNFGSTFTNDLNINIIFGLSQTLNCNINGNNTDEEAILWNPDNIPC